MELKKSASVISSMEADDAFTIETLKLTYNKNQCTLLLEFKL